MPLDPSLKQAVKSTRWRIAAAVVLLAVIVTAALGGFRAAPKTSAKSEELGKRVATQALAVTPLRAWLDAKHPLGLADPTPPVDYLVLEADVENLTQRSNNYFLASDLVWLTGQEDQKGKRSDATYRVDDTTILGDLQPKLPVRVRMTWKLPRGQALASPVRFGLYARRYVEKTYLTGESTWLQDGPGMTLRLPVEDRRGRSAP